MKKRTTKEETDAVHTAALPIGHGGEAHDTSATVSSLQLKQRAQMMAASMSAASLRALQSQMAAPVQRAPDEELVQAKNSPVAQMKGKVPVNHDAALENEADAMGGRALAKGAALGSQDQDASPAMSQLSASGPSDRAVVQMAGHEEDLCFVGKWLVKRADSMEIAQYLAGEVPATAPLFHGPFYTAQAALSFLHDSAEQVAGDKLAKIHLMEEPMRDGGKGFMMLANATAGMASPTMRDLKMGTQTADGEDQERHQVTGLDKDFKLTRHAAMDWKSGSSERGYRDEDRWKASKFGDNLDELGAMLERASPMALKMIFRDLMTFKVWLHTTKVIYVGMSILIISAGEQGKAVAIDFEHPIRDTEASFSMHLKGLLLGVENVLALVAEFIGSFAGRMDADRRARTRTILSTGAGAGIDRGSINNTEEGNASIGDYEL